MYGPLDVGEASDKGASLFFRIVVMGDGHLGHAGSTAKKTGRDSRLALSIPVFIV